MDDKQIEEIIRDSWSPCSPKGMKERVLRNCRNELSKPRKSLAFCFGWQSAFTSLTILVLLFSMYSDHARQQRLSLLLDGGMSHRKNVPLNLKEQLELYGELSARLLPEDRSAEIHREKKI